MRGVLKWLAGAVLIAAVGFASPAEVPAEVRAEVPAEVQAEAQAEEDGEGTGETEAEAGLEEYDLTEVEEFLRENLSSSRESFSFSDLLVTLMDGDISEAAGMLVRSAGRSLSA